jgi:hypothetical protein
MKSSYEQRWGHSHTKKATHHLAVKEQKRKEAEARNKTYQKSKGHA